MKMQDKGLCMQCVGCLGDVKLKCNVGVCKGLTMQRNVWFEMFGLGQSWCLIVLLGIWRLLMFGQCFWI